MSLGIRSCLLVAALAARVSAQVAPPLRPAAIPQFTSIAPVQRALWGTVIPVAAGVALASGSQPGSMGRGLGGGIALMGISLGPGFGYIGASREESRRGEMGAMFRSIVTLAASARCGAKCEHNRLFLTGVGVASVSAVIDIARLRHAPSGRH